MKEGEKNDLLDINQVEMLIQLNKLELYVLEKLYNNLKREQEVTNETPEL